MSLTPQDIKRLKELCEKAWPAPWTAKQAEYIDGSGFAGFWKIWDADNEHDISECPTKGNAEFIAAARIALPALIERVEKLERVAEASRNYVYTSVVYDKTYLLKEFREALAALDAEGG